MTLETSIDTQKNLLNSAVPQPAASLRLTEQRPERLLPWQRSSMHAVKGEKREEQAPNVADYTGIVVVLQMGM